MLGPSFGQTQRRGKSRLLFSTHICSPNYLTRLSEFNVSTQQATNVERFSNRHSSCRRVDDRLDVFEGILDNPWFLGVQAITFIGQIIIVFKGGAAFETEPLTGAQWGWSILFGILVIPVGAAVRCTPNWWFEAAGRALKPLAWPCLTLMQRAKDKKVERARWKEVGQQKQKKGVEAVVYREEVARWERHRTRHDWIKRMHGGDRSRVCPGSKRSDDVHLTALGGKAGTSTSLPPTGVERDGDYGPLDLLSAVEASKYNILDGALPGLHVHTETSKDDSVLMMPPTLEEVLRGKLKLGRQIVPPSQNWEVMRYMGNSRRRGRSAALHD